ncbi:MAG: acetate uptake transporter, partial [Actinobacteria bacterium]|nr:acetate uptake transporter [Actinomycetota bacterium]
MSASDVSPGLRAPAGQQETPARAPAIADPVPVGIAGFGMTTFVLSCINAGFFTGAAGAPMVLGLAIFYGGLVQLIAGIWAFRRGETFVAAAFCSYGGGFWLSYFFLSFVIAPKLSPAVAGNAIGLYLLAWAIFTFYMTIAALRTNLAVLWVFITLTATYVLLTLAELGIATTSLSQIGGYVGITCGVTAWYVAFAHVVNATFKRDLI